MAVAPGDQDDMVERVPVLGGASRLGKVRVVEPGMIHPGPVDASADLGNKAGQMLGRQVVVEPAALGGWRSRVVCHVSDGTLADRHFQRKAKYYIARTGSFGLND